MQPVSPRWGFALALAHQSHRDSKCSHFELNRSHRVLLFGLTELGQMCVTVGFCVEAIYTPPPPSPYVREPSERAYTSSIHFLRENHLLMCWDQDIPILPQESWFLAFPKLLSTQIIFPPYPNLWERVECWGDYHLKHKSKEFIINTPSITFWRVVSPRLVRCRLGASDKIVELNQEVCKGKEIAYFVKIYPSEESPSWVMVMAG